MRLASEKAGRNEFLEIVQGPTAIAFAYGDDVVAPARTLTDFIRASRLEVALYGAFVEGQILDRRGIEDLASVHLKVLWQGSLAA